MTRISHVDQVLMLLRQQLRTLSKADRSRRSGQASLAGATRRQPAANRIEALTRNGDLGEEDLARALISALLTDEFGEAAANDRKFQRLTDEVHRILTSDPKARDLLAGVIEKARNPGNPLSGPD